MGVLPPTICLMKFILQKEVLPNFVTQCRDMRTKVQLTQNLTRLTLFTRPNCSLCDSAKLVLQALGRTKHFEMKQVDVMDPVNKRWKMIYEFDTPVVRFS